MEFLTMVDTQSGHVVQQVVTNESSLSLGSLFFGADFVVQLIIVALLLTSFFSWSIILNKIGFLKKAMAKSLLLEKEFWQTESFSSFEKGLRGTEKDPIAKLFLMGREEIARFSTCYPKPSSQDLGLLESRLKRTMGIYITSYITRIQSHVGFLATVGSAAPFVGLFGTVWGIMHSFQSIAGAKSTSLAVVAPGIAEALFATALGLVAAIPAVIAYNKISSMINNYGHQLENFMEELVSIIQQNAMQR